MAGFTRKHYPSIVAFGARRWQRWGWTLYPADLIALLIGAFVVAGLSIFVWRSGGNDVREYVFYARQFWGGPLAFHRLPIEYPPLAMLVFSLALAPPLMDPGTTFICWMMLFVLATYCLTASLASRRQAWAAMGYLLVGLAPMSLARFDIVPAFVTLAAYFAAQRQRYLLSYALLAIGILLKIYPIFLVPLIMQSQWREAAHPQRDHLTASTPSRGSLTRRRAQRDHLTASAPSRGSLTRRRAQRDSALGIAILESLLVVVFASATWLDPQRAFTSLTYAAGRPTQIESTWSLAVACARLLGVPAPYLWSFGSNNWGGTLSFQLAHLALPTMVVGVLGVYVWVWLRRPPLSAAFLVTLSVLVLTNAVFSPQYLIWLIPFVAVTYGFDAGWIAVVLLTLADIFAYPFVHHYTNDQVNHFLLLVAARNLLLVVLTIRVLWRTGGVRASTPAQRPSADQALAES